MPVQKSPTPVSAAVRQYEKFSQKSYHCPVFYDIITTETARKRRNTIWPDRKRITERAFPLL
jgi:hypothetical protein